MFEVAYLDPNETNLIGLSGPFPTAENAQSALCAFREAQRDQSEYDVSRCVVLEIPDPIPVRFQIVFHDHRSKSTWECIPSQGRRFWRSAKAAQAALANLLQKPVAERGPVNREHFEIEEIPLEPYPFRSISRRRRPPYGRYGRRAAWKRAIVEDTGQQVWLRKDWPADIPGMAENPL